MVINVLTKENFKSIITFINLPMVESVSIYLWLSLYRFTYGWVCIDLPMVESVTSVGFVDVAAAVDVAVVVVVVVGVVEVVVGSGVVVAEI